MDYPLIRTPDARGHNSIIDQIVSDATPALSTGLFTNSLPLAKKMILTGRGLGLYTKLGFLPEIEEGQLRFIPLDIAELNDLKFGVIVTARSAMEPAKRIMSNTIAEMFKRINLGA